MLGLYTAASGMISQWTTMDVISNNLANVNTTSFKRDTALFKSFPERLMARMNDEVQKFPLGSYDSSPIVGKVGTGVELNDIFTRFERKDGENVIPIRKTDSPFDFALNGEGFFSIETPAGEEYTRAGVFSRNQDGFLVDMNGNFVLGQNGRIQLTEGELKVDQQGNIFLKPPLETESTFIDQFKVMDFQDKQGLFKKGSNYYAATEDSGEVFSASGIEILQGFLEGSNVNAVREMTSMIEVQRLYEACQKSVQAADDVMRKESNDIMRMG